MKYYTALMAAILHFPLWLPEQRLEQPDFKAKQETSFLSVQQYSTSSLTRLQNSREINNWDFWEGDREGEEEEEEEY